MDFVVKQGDLLRELQYVQGVVEKKTTVPILSNILLETTGTTLAVTATDLDVTIRCVGCPAQVKVSGSATVSARKLFDIVRLLPDDEIHFKSDGREWINVSCRRSKFKIASLSKENFPDVPESEGTPIELDGGALHYMISRCIYAITQEESRFALNGALLILRPGRMSFVTTDGHRLALVGREIEIGGLEGETRNLIPRKTLAELRKLTASGSPLVAFSKTDKHFFFTVGERVLISRILSGQFPNYEMVIPQDNDKEVHLETLDFSDALRRVATMADEQSKAVRCSLKDGQLEVSSNSADFGEAKEALSADYSGDSMAICFNAQYLLEFLAGLESEKVILFLKDEETQGLLMPEGPEEYSEKYIVMPMKL
jgi:DNA polymerase-3 subunit beta